MEMTLLADWDYDALASLMQIYFDYSHTPSYYEPIDAIQAEGDIFVHPYSDCVQEGKQIRSAAPMNHTVDETCNMSYLYATAMAFEAAYYRATAKEIRFSTDYLQTCVFDPKWNCEGTDPREGPPPQYTPVCRRPATKRLRQYSSWMLSTRTRLPVPGLCTNFPFPV